MSSAPWNTQAGSNRSSGWGDMAVPGEAVWGYQQSMHRSTFGHGNKSMDSTIPVGHWSSNQMAQQPSIASHRTPRTAHWTDHTPAGSGYSSDGRAWSNTNSWTHRPTPEYHEGNIDTMDANSGYWPAASSTSISSKPHANGSTARFSHGYLGSSTIGSPNAHNIGETQSAVCPPWAPPRPAPRSPAHAQARPDYVAHLRAPPSPAPAQARPDYVAHLRLRPQHPSAVSPSVARPRVTPASYHSQPRVTAGIPAVDSSSAAPMSATNTAHGLQHPHATDPDSRAAFFSALFEKFKRPYWYFPAPNAGAQPYSREAPVLDVPLTVKRGANRPARATPMALPRPAPRSPAHAQAQLGHVARPWVHPQPPSAVSRPAAQPLACAPGQTELPTDSSIRLLAALKDGLQEPLKLYSPRGSASSSMTKLPTPDVIDHTDGHLPIPTSCGQCSGLFGKATIPACSQTVLLTNITDLPSRKEVVLAACPIPSPVVTPVVPSQPTPSLLSGIHYGESVWLPTSLLHALDF